MTVWWPTTTVLTVETAVQYLPSYRSKGSFDAEDGEGVDLSPSFHIEYYRVSSIWPYLPYRDSGYVLCDTRYSRRIANVRTTVVRDQSGRVRAGEKGSQIYTLSTLPLLCVYACNAVSPYMHMYCLYICVDYFTVPEYAE